MDAITTPPAPVNEPNLNYAPGSAERAGIEAELAHLARQPARPDRHHRRSQDDGRRRRDPGGAAARPRERARRAQELHEARRPGGRARRGRRGPRLAGDVLRRPRRDHPQGGRPARRPVARPAQRGHDAGPVQDGVAGRDRRGLRADRLLALQRALRPADPGRAADRQQPRRLEPHRPPAARGLRLRDHAVQLHRDRRQPAHGPGADGQHGHLEAVADPAARRAPDDGAARGGRHAAGRDQHAPRRRARGLRRGAEPPRPRRHPLHRLDADLPEAVGHRRRATCRRTAPTRASSARPAARTSSSRTRRPTWTCCGWR